MKTQMKLLIAIAGIGGIYLTGTFGYMIIEGWDFSRIPEDSDWRQRAMAGSAARPPKGSHKKPYRFLMDLEDHGFVQARSVDGGMEIYGLVFIPARGMRLLYGCGESRDALP